ncbi:hypothetical protein HDU93_008019 [Gonapodya sp. JEL0774]|nr:hypothetical protein HDU93_008019 [Gonapodya sp. JEL0774]
MGKKQQGLNGYLRNIPKSQTVVPIHQVGSASQLSVTEKIERSRALAARKRSNLETRGSRLVNGRSVVEATDAIVLQERIQKTLTMDGTATIPPLRRMCLAVVAASLDTYGATFEGTRRFFSLPDSLRDEILLLAPRLVPEKIPSNLALFAGVRPSRTLDLSGTLVTLDQFGLLFPRPSPKINHLAQDGFTSWEEVVEMEQENDSLSVHIPTTIGTSISTVDVSYCPNVRCFHLAKVLVSCTPQIQQLRMAGLESDREDCKAGWSLMSRQLVGLRELDISHTHAEWLADSFILEFFGAERWFNVLEVLRVVACRVSSLCKIKMRDIRPALHIAVK